MTSSSQRRDAAIASHRAQQENTQQMQAVREREQRERAQRRDAAFQAWITTAFPLISHNVAKVSDDFARRGSPYLIRPAQPTAAGMAVFEVRPSGNLNAAARLQFATDDNGNVTATTTANGADSLPASVPVSGVTAEWIENIAEDVLVAVLNGNQMRIPD